MIKLIGRDKETGAMVIENCAHIDKMGIFNFLNRLDRNLRLSYLTNRTSSGFENIRFWIETEKVGTECDTTRQKPPKAKDAGGKK